MLQRQNRVDDILEKKPRVDDILKYQHAFANRHAVEYLTRFRGNMQWTPNCPQGHGDGGNILGTDICSLQHLVGVVLLI